MDIFVAKAEVKSTSVFQAQMLYIDLHDWLVENGYAPAIDPEFPEKLVWESRQQNGTREFWVWWRPTKVIEGNRFWRRVINIDFHGVRMSKVELMHQGKKITADKGKLELLLQAKLEIDVGGLWKKSWLEPFLEPFWKRIYRKEIDMYKEEVMNDMRVIQDIGRRFFGLGQFSVDKQSYMPTKGFVEKEY